MKNIKNKKGISLIVLVITILVMIILAGVVVVTMSQNNPIDKAKEATGVNNLATLKEEVEMLKANKLSSGESGSFDLTREEASKALKSIPGNLKGEVIVTGGRLGVNYSKLENQAVLEFAMTNDIFDITDVTKPEADIYTYAKNGKTYARIDALDLDTDILKIKNIQTGEEKIINRNFEKIGYRRSNPREPDLVLPLLKKTFPSIVDLNDFESIDNYNVLIVAGGYYSSHPYGDRGEEKLIRFFNQGTAAKPKYLITSGNDTRTGLTNHPLYAVNTRQASSVIVKGTKVVAKDDNITRQIDKWINPQSSVNEDTQVDMLFKESPFLTRYYKANVTGGSGVSTYLNKDNVGMYKDASSGKGWFHMQVSPAYSASANKNFANTYKAVIFKMTGSRSMEVEAKSGVNSFEVTDLAGNKKIFEITI